MSASNAALVYPGTEIKQADPHMGDASAENSTPAAPAVAGNDMVSRAIADGLMVLPEDGGIPPLLRKKARSLATPLALQPVVKAGLPIEPAKPVTRPDEIDVRDIPPPVLSDNVVTPHPAVFRSQATPVAINNPDNAPPLAPVAAIHEKLESAMTSEAPARKPLTPEAPPLHLVRNMIPPQPVKPEEQARPDIPQATPTPAVPPQAVSPAAVEPAGPVPQQPQAPYQPSPQQQSFAGNGMAHDPNQLPPQGYGQPQAPIPAPGFGYPAYGHQAPAYPAMNYPAMNYPGPALPPPGYPPNGYGYPAQYPAQYPGQNAGYYQGDYPDHFQQHQNSGYGFREGPFVERRQTERRPPMPAGFAHDPMQHRTPASTAGVQADSGAQLFSSLLQYLPPPGQFWSQQERANWLDAAATLFDLAYGNLNPDDRAPKLTRANHRERSR